jgi:ketosteroid isomerase-like protein
VSQENVEIVLACARAYFAGDLDGCLAFCAPEVEAFPDAGVFPEAAPLRDRETFRRWLEEAGSAFASMEGYPRETLVLADGRIALSYEWGGVGAASGARTLAAVTAIFTLQSRLITRVEFYFNRHEALKAVGLKE